MADDEQPVTGEITTTSPATVPWHTPRITVTDLTAEPEAAPEPVYPRTALAAGMGEAITPASLEAACLDALEMGELWGWGEWTTDYGPGRGRFSPMIPVRHRWKVGQPLELWSAGGPCRSFSPAYLADWTLLLDDGPAYRAQEARRRPAQPQGWRAVWERLFPSSRDPAIRAEDQQARPPEGYFRITRGDLHTGP